MNNYSDHENTITYQDINSIRTFNILEASRLLGAHKETIRRMAASGEIPGVKIGRSWRFIEADLSIMNVPCSIDLLVV